MIRWWPVSVWLTRASPCAGHAQGECFRYCTHQADTHTYIYRCIFFGGYNRVWPSTVCVTGGSGWSTVRGESKFDVERLRIWLPPDLKNSLLVFLTPTHSHTVSLTHYPTDSHIHSYTHSLRSEKLKIQYIELYSGVYKWRRKRHKSSKSYLKNVCEWVGVDARALAHM